MGEPDAAAVEELDLAKPRAAWECDAVSAAATAVAGVAPDFLYGVATAPAAGRTGAGTGQVGDVDGGMERARAGASRTVVDYRTARLLHTTLHPDQHPPRSISRTTLSGVGVSGFISGLESAALIPYSGAIYLNHFDRLRLAERLTDIPFSTYYKIPQAGDQAVFVFVQPQIRTRRLIQSPESMTRRRGDAQVLHADLANQPAQAAGRRILDLPSTFRLVRRAECRTDDGGPP